MISDEPIKKQKPWYKKKILVFIVLGTTYIILTLLQYLYINEHITPEARDKFFFLLYLLGGSFYLYIAWNQYYDKSGQTPARDAYKRASEKVRELRKNLI